MTMHTNCFVDSSESSEHISLEMAKDHSKKQMITDIAISRVPYIRYPNIPECAYQSIQDFSKDTLRISKEKNDSNEVAIVFSLRHIIEGVNPVFGVAFGGEHNVNPEDSVEAYHLLHSEAECVLVLTHNHPSTATFSLEDIYMFIRSFNIKLMLAVSNAGKIYYMVRKETFSFEGALTLAHEAADRYINAITLEQRIDATKYFLHNCNKFGILYGH